VERRRSTPFVLRPGGLVATLRPIRVRRLVAMAALVPALSACVIVTGPDDDDDDLDRNRRRWETSFVDHYDYTVRRHCYCGFEITEPVRVYVRFGQVVDLRYVSDGAPVPYAYAHLFPSIDGLFDIVDHAVHGGADDVDVRYDASLGFPRQIDIDYRRNAQDDELFIEAYGLIER
jgi:hypothetical protein